jgi:hypothetical protein
MLTTKEKLKAYLEGALYAILLTSAGLVFAEILDRNFDHATNVEIAKALYFFMIGVLSGFWYTNWIDSRLAKKRREERNNAKA